MINNFSEQYSNFLTYLKNQKKNIHNNDNNDSSASSSEDIKQLPKRGFFLFPNRRSSPTISTNIFLWKKISLGYIFWIKKYNY